LLNELVHFCGNGNIGRDGDAFTVFSLYFGCCTFCCVSVDVADYHAGTALCQHQSNLSADTLAAVREAKKKGALVLAICNVLGSSLVRESSGVIYTHAGPEIGVASTKAYTAQLAILYLFALYLAEIRQTISPDKKINLSIA
jgi:glucosamine--fructose-6-phosphate aminotransferase (isomerizing)